MRHKFSSIQDYRAFLVRRRRQILLAFLAVSGLITLVTLLLPPIYQSTSTILIESQMIPQDLIRTTVTSYVEERLKIISQEVMSRANLLQVIQRFNLYADMKERYTTEEIIEQMREDISLEMVSAETMDRRTGRPTPVTVAFTLAYQGKDPQKVQNVANALASLYLEENLKTRTSMAETSVSFLEKQADVYRKQCADLEQQVAGFKEKHLGELPELLQLNLQTEQQMRNQIDNLDREIRTVQDRKVYLEGQLATVRPDSSVIDETGKRVLDSKERLKFLQSQLVSLEANYSPQHPDVVKTRNEVAELQKQVGAKDDVQRKRKELAEKQAALKELLGRATPQHPDVIKLQREIAQYEQDIKQASQAGVLAKAPAEDADNPAYINLRTQITSTGLDLASLKRQRDSLHDKWLSYVRRLEGMPRVESGYADMARDLDNAKAKYRETMDKLMQARQGLSLEENQAGEKFTIVEPAQYPESPAKPQRLAIILIGLTLGLGTGIGYASIAEFSDSSVRTGEDLQEITGMPVLAVIPRIYTASELAERRQKRVYYLAGGAALLVVLTLLIHFFVIDLGLLFSDTLKRLVSG